MAIEFTSEKNNKKQKELQERENILAKQEGRKAKKIKVKKDKKKPIEIFSTTFLTLSIIGLIYSISFCFSSFVVMVPIAILWMLWFLLVVVGSAFTIGIVWASEGWRSFITSFTDFNSKISESSAIFLDFLNKSFPYFISVFAICIIAYLTIEIIQYKTHKEDKKYKNKLIWSIIISTLFLAFAIADIVILLVK